MTEYKVLSTCQRRGYKLTDIEIWEATRGHEWIGYERKGEPCDPPEYIDLGTGEPELILPHGAKIISKSDYVKPKESKPVAKQATAVVEEDMSIENIISSLQKLVDERDTLLQQVEELSNRPVEVVEPTIELVDRWRIQFRWYGSSMALEQEWGFHSEQQAQERFDHWVSTFGDKFQDVEILPYKIDVEGDLQYGDTKYKDK